MTKKSAPKKLAKSQQLLPFAIDPSAVPAELASLQAWLASTPNFKEMEHAVPEFAARQNLCAAIGVMCGEQLLQPDRFGFELSLGGNYFPDFVIGDHKSRSLVLVELEGAEPHQIFHLQRYGQQYPDFSTGFRQGFFQLLDWTHRLKDASKANLIDWFTFEPSNVRTVLVVGRDSELGPDPLSQARRRLESLAASFAPGGNKLFVYTYDQLLVSLKARLAASL